MKTTYLTKRGIDYKTESIHIGYKQGKEVYLVKETVYSISKGLISQAIEVKTQDKAFDGFFWELNGVLTNTNWYDEAIKRDKYLSYQRNGSYFG